MLPYIARELQSGTPLKRITRPMLGLFQGMPGARAWRRELSGPDTGATEGTGTVERALAHVCAQPRPHSTLDGYRQHYG
jgi:tRNA-dihydrouridine synthase A